MVEYYIISCSICYHQEHSKIAHKQDRMVMSVRYDGERTSALLVVSALHLDWRKNTAAQCGDADARSTNLKILSLLVSRHS